MVKIYIVFRYGHIICVDSKESVLEAMKVAEFHAEYAGTADCHFEVWTAGNMVHSTKTD